ncbi:MAG: NAD/NADP octopine/nopaline dehydrogenase family protein [Anaerovoracaceae bacterium]
MKDMKYLEEKPIAVLGASAVGKTCAADIKLAGKEVRLYAMEPYSEKSIAHLDRTGIKLEGVQRNLYGFERSGKVFLDLVTTNMEEAVKGVGLIVIAIPAHGHKAFFEKLIPLLEDGQVIHIFTDNFGTLLLRKMMREQGCKKDVIIGGWSSAPYGTRIDVIGGFNLPCVNVKYRAITLRGAAMPMSHNDEFMESTKYLPCLDSITNGDGFQIGNTVLDIGFANINPVIHVPATILGVSTMENWGKIFGDREPNSYSMYSHGLCKSICEVQYQFYQEEKMLADAIGVSVPEYSYESFFSRRSILAQEYMGLDKNGKDNMRLSLDEVSSEGNVGPESINHRYLTEDVPVSCKIYHELGVKFGVQTPIIDTMIVLAGAMHKKDFYKESIYGLSYLGIKDMDKKELLEYLNYGK